MKKRDLSEELEAIVDNTKVIKIDATEEIKHSFIAYAMAVNVSRAIPDVRDGLKPVHRRILYAMNELGLTNDKPYRKSARIVGDVLGKYHPHGDSAVYEALVRLAQDFSIRYTLVEGQGNFGSVDGDPPAAQRYTEARLSKIANEMLREIDKNTVNFVPNFDDTLQQPTVLPSRFPNLLVNGSDGIAVGMATNIPPHNLKEVCDGAIALINNPEITIDELMRIIPAPDYPTGGIIIGRANVMQAYKTGRGGITVRAKTEIVEPENGGKAKIVVTELPYQVNKARLIEQIATLVKEKRVDGISDIKEESDRFGMRIVIDVKKDANAQVVLNTLYKHSQLQVGSGIIFLALVDGQPKVLNLKEMLYHYVEHQKQVIIRRTKYDLEKAEERKHIIEGLVKALANIDEVIKIIKKSSDRQDASAKLIDKFLLSDKQAAAILDMRLQRLTSLEVEKLKNELKELEALVAELKSILASKQKINEIIIKELTEVKEQYGDDRRTEISMDFEDLDLAALTEKQDVVVSVTHYGYIKRIPVKEYESQHRGGKGVTAHKPKEEDFVEQMFISNTHEKILFFTNFGKVYSLMGYEIPEYERTSRGRAIINLLPLADGEKVESALPLPDGSKGYIVMATTQGLIKKTSVDEFSRINRNGKIAIKLVEGDRLLNAELSNGYDEIIIASHEGKCIKFSEEDVRPMGRASQGVKSMKINKGDYAVDMCVIKPKHHILTIAENGYGKRSEPEEYRLQSRSGKGIKAGVFNEKTGKLCALKQVAENQDVMLIANNGTIIRIRAKDISLIGRNTQGVRVMRFKVDGAHVATVAIAESSDTIEE